MSQFSQKEFNLGSINSKIFNIKGEPLIIIVRKVTYEDNAIRKMYLSKLTEQYAEFVSLGYNKTQLFRLTWEIAELKSIRFINDKRNRLEFSKHAIASNICTYDILMALTACNLSDHEQKPVFNFKNGLISNKNKELPLTSWNILPEKTKKEIYDKVLEMNPDWLGETDRIINSINDMFGLKESSGNFGDLALNVQSVFVKSKSHLFSLIEEIKLSVFENNGVIKIDIPLSDLGLREVIPPPKNIVLVLSGKTREKNIQLQGYLGIVENGNFELKIVVKRHKMYYWDIDIDNIVDELRVAIKWWKESGLYTDEEIEAIESEKY